MKKLIRALNGLFFLDFRHPKKNWVRVFVQK
jgi:hypothetical protein